MNLKDKFNITAEKSDAALGDESQRWDSSQQNPSQQWWESAMFTEPAQDSQR